jgi:hypothetical protein
LLYKNATNSHFSFFFGLIRPQRGLLFQDLRYLYIIYDFIYLLRELFYILYWFFFMFCIFFHITYFGSKF